MAKVPVYPTPQVELRPLPGVRQESIASPSLFSAGAQDQQTLGRQMLAGGTLLNRAAVEMAERENADALFRAETAIKDEYLAYEQGVRQKRGQAAWGVATETAQWWKDTEQRHAAQMGNEMQRKLLNASVTRMRQGSVDSVSVFEATERRRSLEESARASIVSSINLGASMAGDRMLTSPDGAGGATEVETGRSFTEGDKFTDEQLANMTPEERARHVKITGEAIRGSGDNPEAEAPPLTIGQEITTSRTQGALAKPADPLRQVKQDILNRVQVLAQLNGWSEERRRAEEAVHLSNFHSQVVQARLQKDPADAKRYYELNKAEINGETSLQLERHLEEGNLRRRAQEAVDAIGAMGMPLDESKAYVREHYEGHEEDEIIRRLEANQSANDAAKHKDERAAADEAWKIVVQPGKGRDAIPVATWDRMGGEEQRQVVDYLDARARRAQADAQQKAVKDDLEVLDQVETAMERGDITDRQQLLRYEPYLSKSTIKTLYNKLDKRGTVPPADVRRSFEDRLGKSRSKWSDSEQQQWLAFQDYIYRNVRETKRPEDLDSWADQWFMKGRGTDDSVFTNDPDTYGQAIAAGRTDFYVEPPEASLSTINNAIATLEGVGMKIPKNKHTAGKFYTDYQLPAERWLNAHQLPTTPVLVASYALLKATGKPINPETMDMVSRQLAGLPAATPPVRPELQPGAPMPKSAPVEPQQAPGRPTPPPGAPAAGEGGITAAPVRDMTPAAPPAAWVPVPNRDLQILHNAGGALASGFPLANAGIWGGAEAAADALSRYFTGPLAGKVLPEDLGARMAETFRRYRQQQEQLAHDWTPKLSEYVGRPPGGFGKLVEWADQLTLEKQRALDKDLKATTKIENERERGLAQLEVFRKHGAPGLEWLPAPTGAVDDPAAPLRGLRDPPPAPAQAPAASPTRPSAGAPPAKARAISMDRELEPEKPATGVESVIEDIAPDRGGGWKAPFAEVADWAGKLSATAQKALGAELKATTKIKDKAKRTAKQLEIFRRHGAPAEQINRLKELWR